jgi:hypothetical protein
MTEPQPERFARIAELSTLIAQQITELVIQASVESVREGMEMAAQVCDTVAVTTRNKSEGVFERDIPAIATAEWLRDHIRLMALSVEVPTKTTGDNDA